jgi:hypothetical protein
MQEIEGPVPDHLQGWWEPGMACLHSAAWWRHHWTRSGILDVEVADVLEDGWQYWLQWQHVVSPGNRVEIQAVEADRGACLGYVRAVGRRRADARLDEPVLSLSTEYIAKPLLRVESARSAQ